jgi:hypothetical protein
MSIHNLYHVINDEDGLTHEDTNMVHLETESFSPIQTADIMANQQQ